MKDAQRDALARLAASTDGCTEAMFLAHGVSIETMAELVKSRRAAVTVERLARPPIEIVRVGTTGAGREAIGE